MTPRNAILLLCAAVGIGVLVHCGGGTTPTQPPTTVPTVPATTTTTVPAGIVLPAGMVCDPTPPPLYRMEPKKWRRHGAGWIFDSAPAVWNVDNYCQRVGLSGKFCATRPEGDPQRVACDYLAVGISPETGRWGPTWSRNGQRCDPPNTPNSTHPCLNYDDNQFKLIVKATGVYEACASPLAKVDPEVGSRCGQVDLLTMSVR